MNKPNSKKKEDTSENSGKKKRNPSPEQTEDQKKVGLPDVDMKKFLGCGG